VNVRRVDPKFLETALALFFFTKKLFGKKRKPKRTVRPRSPAAASDQKRQAYRASFEFPVAYTVADRDGERGGLANDLSIGGLRLVGDEDFPDDTVVEMRFTLPNDLIAGVLVEKEVEQTTARGKVKKKLMVPPEPFGAMTVRGKTTIAFLNLHRRKLMHGVQFVGLDDKTAEEIQRFVHVWQIKQLRDRAHSRGE
jgi:c-di-GMP-binding flagellar brake protein YcgR